MHIEFFFKETGDILIDTCVYFVMNDEVYADNGETYESQSSVVGFEDFISECPNIGWRVV